MFRVTDTDLRQAAIDLDDAHRDTTYPFLRILEPSVGRGFLHIYAIGRNALLNPLDSKRRLVFAPEAGKP